MSRMVELECVEVASQGCVVQASSVRFVSLELLLKSPEILNVNRAGWLLYSPIIIQILWICKRGIN